MTTLAIIGTAGRKDDAGRLSSSSFDRMMSGTFSLIKHLQQFPSPLKIVSGGAAWADHIAVQLIKDNIVEPNDLTLYLPANLEYYGFEGLGDAESQRTAETINYYHKQFSLKIGRNSIEELNEVRKRGAVMEVNPYGFKARNTQVALSCKADDHLLAFTFGNGKTNQLPWSITSFPGGTSAQDAGLKWGGTADTFSKATCIKHHGLIGSD